MSTQPFEPKPVPPFGAATPTTRKARRSMRNGFEAFGLRSISVGVRPFTDGVPGRADGGVEGRRDLAGRVGHDRHPSGTGMIRVAVVDDHRPAQPISPVQAMPRGPLISEPACVRALFVRGRDSHTKWI